MRLRTIGSIVAVTTALALVYCVAGPSLRAAPVATNVGTDNCVMCHDSKLADFKKLAKGSRHAEAKGLKEASGCEACHGPGSLHTEDENHKEILNPGKADVKQATAPCLKCHAAFFRPQEFTRSPHYQNKVTCRDCHVVHGVTKEKHQLKQTETELCLSCHKKQKADFRRNSHHPVLEGRLQCSDCHDPHRSSMAGAKGKATGGNECLKCHQQLKGPFRVEHDPMVGGLGDACQTCHFPHGSPNAKLTKMFGRGLCLQCHTDRATHFVGSRCWDAGCHTEVHGGKRRLLFR